MLIYPAIDLMGGQAVRLVRGEASSQERVGDPVELVQRFAAASLIHVVDLDGAFAGERRQTELIARLARAHPIQVGGGVRTLADIESLLDLGVERVVVGSAAVAQPELIDAALARHGAEKLVVAMDVKAGRVAVSGWTELSALEPVNLALRLVEQGVRWVLCTAVHRDGTLEGPDLPLLDALQAVDSRLQVIASGGIGRLDDLKACAHLTAAVVGKALYAGRFTLEEALGCEA